MSERFQTKSIELPEWWPESSGMNTRKLLNKHQKTSTQSPENSGRVQKFLVQSPANFREKSWLPNNVLNTSEWSPEDCRMKCTRLPVEVVRTSKWSLANKWPKNFGTMTRRLPSVVQKLESSPEVSQTKSWILSYKVQKTLAQSLEDFWSRCTNLPVEIWKTFKWRPEKPANEVQKIIEISPVDSWTKFGKLTKEV